MLSNNGRAKELEQPRPDVCVVVPAFNEGKVIGPSLRALLQIFSVDDIYVVSDGSTDDTVEVACSIVWNIYVINKNVGKAKALQELIREGELTKWYKYILFADADSRLDRGFLEKVQKYTADEPACIVGTVTSDRLGLISAYRTYEYGISHRVFKRAQHLTQTITVAPGCSSLYRADVLEKLNFSNHTLTEDFDLTVQIQVNKLGRICYAPDALVITQDPNGMRDYWNQITRWYTGYWQNVILYRLYLPNKKFNFEILLTTLDGMGWIVTVGIAVFYPILFLRLMAYSVVYVWVFASVVLVFEKKLWAVKYVLFFPLFQYVNLVSFLFSLARVLNNRKDEMGWKKVERYTPGTLYEDVGDKVAW